MRPDGIKQSQRWHSIPSKATLKRSTLRAMNRAGQSPGPDLSRALTIAFHATTVLTLRRRRFDASPNRCVWTSLEGVRRTRTTGFAYDRCLLEDASAGGLYQRCAFGDCNLQRSG